MVAGLALLPSGYTSEPCLGSVYSTQIPTITATACSPITTPTAIAEVAGRDEKGLPVFSVMSVILGDMSCEVEDYSPLDSLEFLTTDGAHTNDFDITGPTITVPMFTIDGIQCQATTVPRWRVNEHITVSPLPAWDSPGHASGLVVSHIEGSLRNPKIAIADVLVPACDQLKQLPLLLPADLWLVTDPTAASPVSESYQHTLLQTSTCIVRSPLITSFSGPHQHTVPDINTSAISVLVTDDLQDRHTVIETRRTILDEPEIATKTWTVAAKSLGLGPLVTVIETQQLTIHTPIMTPHTRTLLGQSSAYFCKPTVRQSASSEECNGTQSNITRSRSLPTPGASASSSHPKTETHKSENTFISPTVTSEAGSAVGTIVQESPVGEETHRIVQFIPLDVHTVVETKYDETTVSLQLHAIVETKQKMQTMSLHVHTAIDTELEVYTRSLHMHTKSVIEIRTQTVSIPVHTAVSTQQVIHTIDRTRTKMRNDFTLVSVTAKTFTFSRPITLASKYSFGSIPSSGSSSTTPKSSISSSLASSTWFGPVTGPQESAHIMASLSPDPSSGVSVGIQNLTLATAGSGRSLASSSHALASSSMSEDDITTTQSSDLQTSTRTHDRSHSVAQILPLSANPSVAVPSSTITSTYKHITKSTDSAAMNNTRHTVSRSTSSVISKSDTESLQLKNAAGYLGCFTDAAGIGSARSLQGAENTSQDLTPVLCAQFCSSFKYFGLQYGQECFCSNHLASGTILAPETDCHMHCLGDLSLACGGDWRLSLYEHLVSDSVTFQNAVSTSAEPSSTAAPNDFTTSTPILQSLTVSSTTQASSTITTTNLSTTILDYTSSPDQGIDRGSPSSYHSALSSTTALCNMTANPKTSTTSKISPSLTVHSNPTLSMFGFVYDTCAVEPASSYNGGGVFGHKPALVNDHMTVESCASLCRHFNYFGVRNGRACFCGDEITPLAYPTDSEACNVHCLGNQTQSCGARYMLSFYRKHQLVSPFYKPSSSVSSIIPSSEHSLFASTSTVTLSNLRSESLIPPESPRTSIIATRQTSFTTSTAIERTPSVSKSSVTIPILDIHAHIATAIITSIQSIPLPDPTTVILNSPIWMLPLEQIPHIETALATIIQTVQLPDPTTVVNKNEPDTVILKAPPVRTTIVRTKLDTIVYTKPISPVSSLSPTTVVETHDHTAILYATKVVTSVELVPMPSSAPPSVSTKVVTHYTHKPLQVVYSSKTTTRTSTIKAAQFDTLYEVHHTTTKLLSTYGTTIETKYVALETQTSTRPAGSVGVVTRITTLDPTPTLGCSAGCHDEEDYRGSEDQEDDQEDDNDDDDDDDGELS